MPQPNVDAARTYIVNRMKHELPDRLHYHGLHHTIDDVLPAALRLAQAEGVTGLDRLLLETAVLYHDAGYIEQYFRNEPIGCRIAERALPRYGYTADHIATIKGLIMATQLPQTADTLLQGIICDADLDSLGREDYFIVHHRLQLELNEHGENNTLREWYLRQLEFLQGHTYFTKAAHQLRTKRKKEHIQQIKKMCGVL